MFIHISDPSGEQEEPRNPLNFLGPPSVFEVQRNLVGAAFEVGYRIVSEMGPAIIVISPRNSYYRNEHNLARLFSVALTTFGQLHTLNPWEIAHFTHQGLGAAGTEAVKKARLEGNALRNRIRPILGNLGHGLDHCPEITWGKSVQRHPEFVREYQRLKSLYQARGQFYHDTTEATLQVLGSTTPTPDSAIGVEYLLHEIAGLCAAPEIFSVPRIACVYHRRWPLLERVLSGEYDGRPRSKVGFVVIGQAGGA